MPVAVTVPDVKAVKIRRDALTGAKRLVAKFADLPVMVESSIQFSAEYAVVNGSSYVCCAL